MHIKDRFKQARKHAKLSQEELALAVGCTQGLISKIERGDQEGTGLIVDIAKACGVRPEWLALGQGEMIHEIKYDSLSKTEKVTYKVESPIPPFNVLKIEGKEIKPSELNLLEMYRKLSQDNKDFVDGMVNKLYSMEYPEDKVAAPFNKHHKNHGSKN